MATTQGVGRGAAPGAGQRARHGVDPDALALIEEERDFLLRSLDDLDAEFRAGDVDVDDYEALRADYTARAADALRQIDGQRSAFASAPRPQRRRSAAWILGVVIVASLAGWLLARSVGGRGVTTSLTGSANSPRERLAECQPLSMQDPPKGIECYDRILATDPDNVQALTYRAWAKIRAGDIPAGQVGLDRAVELDPTFPDAFVFRAVVKKNSSDFLGARAEIDRLYSLNPPDALLATMSSMNLEQQIAMGLLAPAVRSCWDQANALQQAAASATTTAVPGHSLAGFGDALACFDAAIAADPTSVDALLGKVSLIIRAGSADYLIPATDALAAASKLAPGDPSVALLRGYLALLTRDTSTMVTQAGVISVAPTRTSPLFAAERTDFDATMQSLRSQIITTTTTPR